MNKFNFFGCAVLAAIFAFSMTSCEKEDFNTNVDIDTEVTPDTQYPEGYKPGDAVVVIDPTVWAIVDGELKNVTNDAEITYNGKEAFNSTEYLNADKGISKMTVEVVATYNELTANATVEVPALSAGQVAVFTPTLIISGVNANDPESQGFQVVKEGSLATTINTLSLSISNTASYAKYDQSISTDEEYEHGSFTSNVTINEGYTDNAEVKAIIEGYNKGESKKLTFVVSQIAALTKVTVPVKQTVETQDYIINEVFETRATSNVEAATFTATNYSYIFDIDNMSVISLGNASGSGSHDGNNGSHDGNNGSHDGNNGSHDDNSHGHGHGTGNAGGGNGSGN